MNTSIPESNGIRFGDMVLSRKITWIGKLLVALLTFGFAFPNVMND